MAQDKETRKKAIAEARSAHHNNQLENNLKRLDTYVQEETKTGLQEIKKMSVDVRNEGQAVDLAVQIALKALKSES
ncbi:hypothetical protein [Vibrio coralliilyticus]|uniref:Uncharacterized protein n=1 Tax=Vibrio coralliilyticus TaxID=190893 RepID=A0AAP6ZNC4_9VIBR|nr:hypothetical protein [Vibrio coralliilyticus]NOI32015.1 hypothetical protein [Vibrio coralliilyticus]NOJ25216.1 hypothetical protein [Vibrio coralliilyticus]